MLRKIKDALKIREIRSKLLFTLFILLVFRLLSAVTIPGVNLQVFKAIVQQSDILQIFNMFSGGAFASLSILTVGLGPYINASYIFQLLSAVVPSIKELYSGGPIERRTLTMYTRLLSVPLAIIQAFVVYFGLTSFSKQFGLPVSILSVNGPVDVAAVISIFVFGATFTMWLGELVSEAGLGGGSSIIILAGILVSIPTSLSYAWRVLIYDWQKLTLILVLLVILILAIVIALSVYKIAVVYAQRVRATGFAGQENFIPVPINPAGVMPVIFAISVVRMPVVVANFLAKQNRWPTIAHIASVVSTWMNNFWVNNLLMLVVTVGFTVFSAFLVFRPKEVAENLAKQGAFVRGVRPGKATEEYLKKVLIYTVFWGALLLGILVLLPNILVVSLKLPTLVVTGTGVLIVASVIIDTLRQVEAIYSTVSEPKEYF